MSIDEATELPTADVDDDEEDAAVLLTEDARNFLYLFY